jgi:hypothetical protein
VLFLALSSILNRSAGGGEIQTHLTRFTPPHVADSTQLAALPYAEEDKAISTDSGALLQEPQVSRIMHVVKDPPSSPRSPSQPTAVAHRSLSQEMAAMHHILLQEPPTARRTVLQPAACRALLQEPLASQRSLIQEPRAEHSVPLQEPPAALSVPLQEPPAARSVPLHEPPAARSVLLQEPPAARSNLLKEQPAALTILREMMACERTNHCCLHGPIVSRFLQVQEPFFGTLIQIRK